MLSRLILTGAISTCALLAPGCASPEDRSSSASQCADEDEQALRRVATELSRVPSVTTDVVRECDSGSDVFVTVTTSASASTEELLAALENRFHCTARMPGSDDPEPEPLDLVCVVAKEYVYVFLGGFGAGTAQVTLK